MLVLSRKESQVVWIGKEIAVQVVEIRGNQVRLGFTAPRDVRIVREEIAEVARRMAAGQPLCEIETALDYQENQA